MLAPKTIDNDLGLNYPNEPDEWAADRDPETHEWYHYTRTPTSAAFDLDHIVNYVTPGYATAVFVSAQGVERIRTTAESHRRIAIIEVMGRHSGYIALGTAYGQPDIILVPEHPLDLNLLVDRVRQLYDLQKNVVIVCGEGIVDEQGVELGDESKSTDPAGNVVLSGAAEALRAKIIQTLGDRYFQHYRRGTRRAKRSSPEKSATRSAAAGQSSSIASMRRSLAPRLSICCSKAATTPYPCFNTMPTRAFTSRATTPTASAIAGA